MSITIAGRSIESVQIIDDDPNVRDAYTDDVVDLNLRPILVDGPLEDVDKFVQGFDIKSQAAICDYHLTKRNYATFNGAEMVAKLYKSQIPSILCTRYESTIVEIRQYRRYIPVLLNPNELNPDSLIHGFTQCIEEFDGNYKPSRRMWRTLIRVEEIDEKRSLFSVVIPGWNPNKVITLSMINLPDKVKNLLDKQTRFHAKVNTGAEHEDELFFEDWEIE